jgi:hypothetical protein
MTDHTERILSLRETARELRTYLGPNLRVLVLGGALLVVSSLLGLMQPLAARWILDRLAAGQDLLLPILGLCGLVIVAALSLATGSFLMLRSAEEVVLSGRRHHRAPGPELRPQATSSPVSRRTRPCCARSPCSR